MANKPKTTRPNDITADTWCQVGSWIADSAHDMEIDAAEVEQSNPGLTPALRGLSDYLLRGGTLSEGRPSAADIVTMLRNRAKMSPPAGARALQGAADEIERMSKALASKKRSPSTPRARKGAQAAAERRLDRRPTDASDADPLAAEAPEMANIVDARARRAKAAS